MRGRGHGVGPVVEGSCVGQQIFIGNLPYHTSWQDLKDLFAEFGLKFLEGGNYFFCIFMNCLFSFAGTIICADVLLGPDGCLKGMGTIL